MSWDNVLRMLRLRRDPDPDDTEDVDLAKAHREVEELHRKADRVLADYAAADNAYRRK